MPRKIKVELSEEQRIKLERTSHSKTEEARRVQRAKILIAAADGVTSTSIAQTAGLSRKAVYDVIKKFTDMGMDAALSDLARKGRPPVISDEEKAWVVSVACQKPKDIGYAQELWTIKKLAEHIRKTCEKAGYRGLTTIAKSKVWKILDSLDIKPHKIRYYLERRDEDFDQKMQDVLIVYKQVEVELATDAASGIVTVSYDEKPGIQAIENTAPDLAPTQTHGYICRDYEYKRHGTVSLLAGLNLRTGEVTGIVRDRHRSLEFIEFLEHLDERYTDAERIRIVLDNHSAHTSKETRGYLALHPGRFEFVFTPKHGSWLNLVESFFGKFARVCLRGIRVSSKEELISRIYQYIKEINEVPVVYHWKYKMDEIVI